MADTINKEKIAQTAKKMAQACIKFKQPRLSEVKKFFELYANKVDKALPGRFNVPIPVVGGFVDTLKSKIDDEPILKYKENDETDYKRVQMANAMWQWDKSPNRGKWALKDRAAKISAIFTGRGILSYFAESEPEYKSNLQVIDLFDFIFEPQGGADLDNHLFVGQTNIFKSVSDLQTGVKNGLYNSEQVQKLITGQSSTDEKRVEDEHENQTTRFEVYGLDPNTNNYVGQKIFSLCQMFLDFEGKKYYILFDLKTAIWVRVEPIKEVFKSKLQPYVSWATHEDYFNFLSKCALDDIKPIAEATKIIFNQALDNIQKRNWGMRAFDSSIFPNPSELQWRPDGLVQANNLNGKAIQSGIYQFETADNTNITVNMMEFMNSYLEKSTGIRPSSIDQQDASQKVGIYYGNMQEVADRLGTLNKSYKETYAQLGLRYLYGLDEHLTEDMSIRVQGIKGSEWVDIKRTDFEFERTPDVDVESASTEFEMDEAKNQRRANALAMITANPLLMQKANSGWLFRQVLKNGEFNDEDIRVAMDTQNDGNAEILSEAAMAIKEIISGNQPKLNKGATTGFVQKILDYDIDHDLKQEVSQALRDYAQAHIEIALRNMMKQVQMNGGMLSPQGMPPTQPIQPSQPPQSPQGMTASRSATVSNQMAGI